MKSILKKIFFCRPLAKVLIRPVLWTHSFSYNLAGKYSCILNNGIHPKHRILKYEEWFLSHISNEDVILDVGCNTGMLPFLLSDKAGYVYGIEINESNIKIAREVHQKDNIEYICADATKYNYDSCRPINCVILSNVLEHIEFRVEFLKKLLSEIKWANEGNKMFLFRVPMLEREWIVLYKKECGVEYKLDPVHYTEYTVSQLRAELKEVGIVVQNIEIRFGEIYAVGKAA